MSKRSDFSTPIDSQLLAVPNYEVKLFLDPEKVLDLEFKPTSEAADTLDLKHSNRKIALLFLDADPPQLNVEGWTVRARKFEDSEKLELSYKRRYPIEPGRLVEARPRAPRRATAARYDSANRDGTQRDHQRNHPGARRDDGIRWPARGSDRPDDKPAPARHDRPRGRLLGLSRSGRLSGRPDPPRR